MSSLLLLILVIRVFFSLTLVSLPKSFSAFFLKEPSFSLNLLFCILLLSALIFIIPFHLHALGFSLLFSCFVKVEAHVIDLRLFFKYILKVVNFLLSTALFSCMQYILMFVFVFIQLKYSLISLLISSLTHILFRSVKFNFQTLEDFPVSNLIDSEHTLYGFHSFTFMRLVLWLSILPVLVNVSCVPENNMYSFVCWSFLYMLVKSS